MFITRKLMSSFLSTVIYYTDFKVRIGITNTGRHKIKESKTKPKKKTITIMIIYLE